MAISKSGSSDSGAAAAAAAAAAEAARQAAIQAARQAVAEAAKQAAVETARQAAAAQNAIKNALAKDAFTGVSTTPPPKAREAGAGQKALTDALQNRAVAAHLAPHVNGSDVGNDLRCQVAAWVTEGSLPHQAAQTFLEGAHNLSPELAASMNQVFEKLSALEPNTEGARTLQAAFVKDFTRVNEGIAKGTLSPAALQARTAQWGELTASLVPGKDPMEAVGTSGGVTFSQRARVGMEARDDWSLTTRTEAQDLQAPMASALLDGTVPWAAGMQKLQSIAAALPPEGAPQTLVERGEMLSTIRGPFREFFEMSAPAPRVADGASASQAATGASLSLLTDPAKALAQLLSQITETFAALVVTIADLAAHDLAADGFSSALKQASIPAEYQPVEMSHAAAKDDSWNWKDGDTNALHYFAVDVRNPTTGQSEQNVYHLNPDTGVFSQVSNLDANGFRLQEPKSPAWTAGPNPP